MSLLGLLLFLAAVITCYAAAIALLLCPWLGKGCGAVSIILDIDSPFPSGFSVFPDLP